MNNLKQYELYWNTIPMGALTGYQDWYCPCLGQGVYMFELDTNNRMSTRHFMSENPKISANAGIVIFSIGS